MPSNHLLLGKIKTRYKSINVFYKFINQIYCAYSYPN
nr:MAG TPA: hypothetical protein [Caudoviricetes sp.]